MSGRACAVCGDPVTTGPGVEGFVGWEDAEGRIADREVVLVVHAECWLRTPSAELDALLDEAAGREEAP